MNDLYTLLDEEGFVLNAVFADECPINGVKELLTENFIRPKFDSVSRKFYEGANQDEKQSEIDKINEHYTAEISKLVTKFVEKSIIDGIPIPQNILDQRATLRLECNTKIKEIDSNQTMLKTKIK